MAVTHDVGLVLDDCRSAGDVLRRLVAEINDDALRVPSALPDWTRGHVLAHLLNVGDGAARQAEYAARSELIEFYDGGREGRDAKIEADALRPVAGQRARVDQVLDRLTRAWPDIGSPVWDRRVTYRDGTLLDVALMWWREIRIHVVDLDAGVGAETWSETFCQHLFDFLAPRLPSGMTVELQPDGKEAWRAPDVPLSPPYVFVHGDVRDIAMWLAGRRPEHMPVAYSDGQRRILPRLNPWPAAR